MPDMQENEGRSEDYFDTTNYLFLAYEDVKLDDLLELKKQNDRISTFDEWEINIINYFIQQKQNK